MVPGSGRDAASQALKQEHIGSISDFPMSGRLESPERIRRFELLRLAFFVLKLRKLEQRLARNEVPQGRAREEAEFRRNLLRHVIFQQLLALIQLDAREQALQIIEACRR
jgi:voltage-gated potassium channel Kch